MAGAAAPTGSYRDRAPGWWNGRHSRLKSGGRKACGFDSRPGYRAPGRPRVGPVALPWTGPRDGEGACWRWGDEVLNRVSAGWGGWAAWRHPPTRRTAT